MTRWRATASLGRAALVATAAATFAVLLGDPVLVVLAGPLALCAALGFVHTTRSRPRLDVVLDH